jgi:putative transposase
VTAPPSHARRVILSSNDPLPKADRWARLRHAIIGPLLAAPPEGGALKEALQQLAQKTYVHPIKNEPVRFGYSTLERWFYRAREATDPVRALREAPRKSAGQTKVFSAKAIELLTGLYQVNYHWSAQLLCDNLRAALERAEPGVPAPSYASVRRYLKRRGMIRRAKPRRDTEGARAAREHLETIEVRSYEVEHVNSLWHCDFHDGSRKVLTKSGALVTPQLFGCLDDCSRLVCHLQWFTDETTESFVQGISQALQRRQLPRIIMSDNGPAMLAREFTEGLARLGILHHRTLPYSAYQNAKQENFWARVEGRLMAMLEGEKQLTLEFLNRATQAWVEHLCGGHDSVAFERRSEDLNLSAIARPQNLLQRTRIGYGRDLGVLRLRSCLNRFLNATRLCGGIVKVHCGENARSFWSTSGCAALPNVC